jgi:hypothetical protein
MVEELLAAFAWHGQGVPCDGLGDMKVARVGLEA